jgi:hypothetical protein
MLLGMGLTVVLAGAAPNQATAQIAQRSGSQAPQVRILDLGVSRAQLQQMQAVGMRMVMPTTVPAGFQLTSVVTPANLPAGSRYLLVYRKGNACFGIEGTRNWLGNGPAGDTRYPIQNAVLGRGQLESLRSPAPGTPQLVSQWLSSGPFYRFVGANYTFEGGAELANCQNISVENALLVSNSLRFLDLDQGVVQTLPTSAVAVVDANSPTSPVEKYPTQQEFNTFKRNLQAGAFGTGATLTSEQIRQRQTYLAPWDKANPPVAKFSGAWSDGSRTYFVYPSTVKARVCVVILNGGKYEFANGQAISQELRYNKNSFFWVDQPGVLAARDQGSSKLFAVFATQSSPDPSAIANFDYGFRNAQCTTELPGMGQNLGGGTR